MKKIYLLFVVLFSFADIQAQDTTWVQTFTFDSIATRRAVFNFPPELNTKRFEKVLMYYKLKCSPLTPWDQYNCGEWDYLTYARIFDHTGVFDSVLVNGDGFEANFTTPSSIDFDLFPFTRADTYVRQEHNRSGPMLVNYQLNSSNGLNRFPFDVSNNGGRFQMLVTAAELSAIGIAAGDIESLTLYLSSFLVNGELKYPSISMKGTTMTELTSLQQGGFQEVYNASHWSGGSQPDFVIGSNELLFYQPFAWNGTDNVIIDFYFENTMNTFNYNFMLFESENILNNTAVGFTAQNGYLQFNGSNKALLELSDFTMGDEMTIAFWSKGTGSAGTNTSILEAYDTLNRRVINIHMPWSDNNLYFDAGLGGTYDRISKAMTTAEIDNNWNHWAFVKKQSTGQMLIYKNGVLWHSGTNLNQSIGYIHRLVLGTNLDNSYDWNGKIDEFQIYNAAVDQATIQQWMTKKIDSNHPFWTNLLTYYTFDNKTWAEDESNGDNKLMPSEFGMFRFDEFPLAGQQQVMKRPMMAFGQGSFSGFMQTTEHPMSVLKEPMVIFEFGPLNRHFDIINGRIGQVSGNETTYDNLNQVVSQSPFVGANNMNNVPVWYYEKPFELVNDVEIGRYITPYGIGFDLGPNGFNYIYDVTDYQQYLHDAVDLATHNTQELIDVKFVFIEGIPPRDVHHRQPIWSEWQSYQYAALDNNTVLPAIDIALSDTSSMFKIKTRLTGHGEQGNGSCCEWAPKIHELKIDGVSRFNWDIWRESQCANNPNTKQGGTWPYAREGWCPGDMVEEYDHELTPFVTSGTTVNVDYDIQNVPTNDQAQGNGNYIVAMDLISYSAPNFQNDAALVDVLNPNNYEYYKKYNPTCSYPRVILQNTGALALTQCVIRIYVESDQVIDFPWTGNLAFLQKEIVEIPVDDITWWQNLNPSTQTFHAEIVSVNGSTSGDDYAFNNVKTTKFQAPEIVTGPFFVWFTTNNKASENKYSLIKDNGDLVFQRTGLSNQSQYKDTFDLAPGCYSIILEDTDDDGISFWYSAIPTNQGGEGETAGSFVLRRVGGSVFETFPGDFGRYHRFNFSIGLDYLNELPENQNTSELFIYPNPTSGEFFIDLGGVINNEAHLEIQDLSGRVILSQEMNTTVSSAETSIDLRAHPAGIYLVKVKTATGVYTKQLVKQ